MSVCAYPDDTEESWGDGPYDGERIENHRQYWGMTHLEYLLGLTNEIDRDTAEGDRAVSLVSP